LQIYGENLFIFAKFYPIEQNITDTDYQKKDHDSFTAMTGQIVMMSMTYRYQRHALEFEKKINSGGYKAGERLPSLREVHTWINLSITTISQAYLELQR